MLNEFGSLFHNLSTANCCIYACLACVVFAVHARACRCPGRHGKLNKNENVLQSTYVTVRVQRHVPAAAQEGTEN